MSSEKKRQVKYVDTCDKCGYADESPWLDDASPIEDYERFIGRTGWFVVSTRNRHGLQVNAQLCATCMEDTGLKAVFEVQKAKEKAAFESLKAEEVKELAAFEAHRS